MNVILKSASIIVLIVFSTSVFSQTETTLILWDKSCHLAPDDFCGITDYNSKYDAVSFIGPKIYYHMIDDEYYIDSVQTFFLKNKSWIKKDLVTKQLLEHENLHFDITELYMRKLRKKYDSLISEGIYEKVIYDKLMDKVMVQMKIVDVQFDEETKHGQFGLQQLEWKNRITKELEAYDSPSSSFKR